MGFIDYSGTKEDRFEEVVEYARSQQEEEALRFKIKNANNWLEEKLHDKRYSALSINDLLKHIIAKYRQLITLKDELAKNLNYTVKIDFKLLWSDFCAFIITNHLNCFDISEEVKKKYYETFMGKVFKFQDATAADVHYSNIESNKQYQRYFIDAFDVISEKNYWKLLGDIGSKNQKELNQFIELYREMSILLQYYLFCSFEPKDYKWQQYINVEYNALGVLINEYNEGKNSKPNLYKLRNPLYYSKLDSRDWTQDGKESTNVKNIIENEGNVTKDVIDRDTIEKLLDNNNLSDYIMACKMILKSGITSQISDLYEELIDRITALQESLDKYKDVYIPDMYQFYDYYIPEALLLTVTFIEYANAKIGDKILNENEQEVISVLRKLIIAVNDKIDEIYKYASIETKAKAKALESMMSQNGYIDSKYRL